MSDREGDIEAQDAQVRKSEKVAGSVKDSVGFDKLDRDFFQPGTDNIRKLLESTKGGFECEGFVHAHFADEGVNSRGYERKMPIEAT